MLAVVVSRADSASVHIGEHLRDLTDWREHTDPARPDADGGGTVRRSGEGGDLVELREFDDLHLDLDGVADAFGRVDEAGGTDAPGRDADDATDRIAPGLLVFASRHAGETGPLLTAHHTGNFGPADYGGAAGELARACPNAHRRVLAALREYAPADYEVGMECTHHGPSSVGAPSMFVEVGSAEPQWDDPDAARAVARAILDLRGVAADAPVEAESGDGERAEDGDGSGDRRHLVGFGGSHYAPRFERVVRETDWAVGHVGADWGLEAMGDPDANRDVLRAAFAKSAATRALVDGEYPALESAIADLGYRVVSETWVRETSGVPLELVDRVESELGTVAEGVRFGAGAERFGDADGESPDRFTVVDLPAELLAEARGIDDDRAWDAVADAAVAFETEQDGSLVGTRAALAGPAGDDHDSADYRRVVESLAAVLRERYDAVEVTDGAVVAQRAAFDPAAARELGVEEGPAFGKLSAGQSVEADGRTVDPEDVHEKAVDRFPY